MFKYFFMSGGSERNLVLIDIFLSCIVLYFSFTACNGLVFAFLHTLKRSERHDVNFFRLSTSVHFNKFSFQH